VAVVRPSPSATITPSHDHPGTRARCSKLPSGFRVLMLSGWHMNKGLEIVPRVASVLRDDHGITDCVFVLSVPEDHPRSADMRREAERLGVLNNLVFFGSVPQDGCAELYRATDATLLLSVLESFSNNIIESWTMGRPLLITDAEWAHELCGNAACYVQRDSERDIARGLAELIQNQPSRQRLVEQGYVMARSYPTLGEKTASYVRFIEQIAALGVR
jgi:glycosyltransferase involved in cell wall biosynthesis